MTKMTKVLVSMVFFLCAPAAFACNYPAPPKSLPDGSSASIDEMKAGIKVIAEYQASMTTYLDCIEADEIVAIQALDDDDEDGKSQRKELFDKKYDAAVDEQTRTVEQFNAEIREYKNR